MELLFLWIEDFRNIQKQGFNFSCELNFIVKNVSKNKDEPNYKLEINNNKDFVRLFDSNIIEVTGIVGKNGSGKSTLLHCLKMMCGKLPTLLSPLIFALLDRETNTIKTYYYRDGGDKDMVPISLEVHNQTENRFKVATASPYTISRLGIDGRNIKGLDFKFTDIACCYFSNAFDSHRENIYEGIHNISTNYRVESFLKKYIATREKVLQKKKEKEVPKIELWPSHIFEYHKSELRTLLKFLSYANTRKTGKLPDLPKGLIIEFNFDDYEYLIKEAPSSFLYDRKRLQEIHKIAFRLISESKDKRENFSNIIVLCSFYYMLRRQLINPDNFHMDEVRSRIYDLLEQPDILFDNIRKILSPLNSPNTQSKDSKTIREFLGETFDKSVKKIQFLDTDTPSDNKVHYRLKIDINLWSVLNFIDDLKTLDDATFIDYSWGTGLSSGEEAFLSHFARLNELRTKIRQKTIWLLVDEGDLYFHPQWQKEYFSHLVSYVKFLFSRKKVQIIISTHSPFIVSDLPKQNLIFLKKNEDGNCLVATNEMQKETFGSNIHELFTDSFFLSDGLMGEFARNNIEALITEVNEVDTISNDDFQNNFKNRIKIVGEPFIRAKLYELVATKSDVNVIDEIIEQRNDEIDNLREIKRRKQNDKNRKS